MKKKLVLIGVVISSIFTLSNCTQEMDAPVTDETGVPFEFCANIKTRTANDGMGTDWVAGDAVNLFHAVAGTTEYVVWVVAANVCLLLILEQPPLLILIMTFIIQRQKLMQSSN